MAYDECYQAGGMTAYNWSEDPRRLAFQFARYKHVAKILEGFGSVLEVGCADGQGARIVKQHVGRVTCVDVDHRAITQARGLMSDRWPIHFAVHDIMSAPIGGFDAVYSLDLIEHVENHEMLIRNLRRCAPVCVIGTPSVESQRYASEISKREHIACLSKDELRARMRMFYGNVFVFGMNDETLHTGFDGMCHYLLALGVA